MEDAGCLPEGLSRQKPRDGQHSVLADKRAELPCGADKCDQIETRGARAAGVAQPWKPGFAPDPRVLRLNLMIAQA
jgi:hypothetical protein